MRRFWILFLTEIKALMRDPISVLGGFIAPGILMVAFGLLFGGRLTFKIAVFNHDTGPWGDVLRQTIDEVISPFGTPYYDVSKLSEDRAWDAYHAHALDGVWVIPPDFSARLDAGQHPIIEMHFDNYNDDRAKNHRIYSAEIVWRFYEKIGRPGPPLALAEEYPRPEMIHWFPLIAVGLVLLGVSLGGLFNIFLLTYKEHLARITLEYGLAPRSLAWILFPKVLLALLMALVTGTALLFVVYLWVGVWPGRFLWAVWLLFGLVALFWASVGLVLGIRIRHYMAGAITGVLGGVIVFFIGGGLAPVRQNWDKVIWPAWLFPNTYAVDPVRDLVLFRSWPTDWTPTLFALIGFALMSLVGGMVLAARRLRRLG
ncbi:MAG: ABC transporter permease [Anaerolineae bacterium]|nr:ABC transporter permease [Anaerolineae bacterium]